ncbi:MAG TPA: hypothetical protein VGA71_03750 [Actinomycetota bacterium]
MGTWLRDPVVVSSMTLPASMPSSFHSAAADRWETAASGPAHNQPAMSFCSQDLGAPRTW